MEANGFILTLLSLVYVTHGVLTHDLSTSIKIVRRDGKFHVTNKDNIEMIYSAYELRAKVYEKNIGCRSFMITDVIVPFKDDDTLSCREVQFQTMICGGHCSGMKYHPKISDNDKLKTTCQACGPSPGARQVLKKIVYCREKATKKTVEKTLKFRIVKACGCHQYKCNPLKDILK